MKNRIGVIGASGYVGYELIKLLEEREDIEIVVSNSESWYNKDLRELYPGYRGTVQLTHYSIDEINEINPDVLFIAMKDGYAKQVVDKLKCRVIDLSRDFRFSDRAIYGLPEMNKEKIRTASLVSNPGCYATGCILGSLPIVANGLAERIIYDCKSGYSGAGRTPAYLNDPKHYTDNVIAYKIVNHPHSDEIKHHLRFEKISFTPHVVPLFRGIMCTIHIILAKRLTPEEAYEMYKEFYKGERQIEVVNYLPELHDVQHTNKCCIGGFEIDDADRLVVIATLDNLLKGASSQAIQNMDLMIGTEVDQNIGVKNSLPKQ
jgi:N-acetyl-gamma-glutamyl-phosphate reductase